ncbi:hypothetical protein Bhyg_08937 [Pseudolycoriella hygida]|uniref:F-box domain-containing protein n=1 Tax=Pseudolycoriella hygida TaxID=35572 RepID=A0A9Q0N5J8_9DIPT|nr:hypothetical protein Bhyg_08937 [Pseudolycoriella hygida]
MNAKKAKRTKLSTDDLEASNLYDSEGRDSTTAETIANNLTPDVSNVKYVALSNPIVLDNIMSYLSYKDVQRLSSCCRELRQLSAIEFERRKIGNSSNYLLFRTKDLTSAAFIRHPNCAAKAVVHIGVEQIQQKLAELTNQLHFRPKLAFLLTGNVNKQEHHQWTSRFKHLLPPDCTILNVLSKTLISGSIDKQVYEVQSDEKIKTCGLAYLLAKAQPPSYDVQVFKSLKELASLTDGETGQHEPVKCILYFSQTSSQKQLPKILSVCKERNDDLSIAFGGLVVDNLSIGARNKIECAGIIFSGSRVRAASTVIEEMTDEGISQSMIRFRDSIPFDINDTTKETICFLLSCIEHSPTVQCRSDFTKPESDIFYTIFPSNVRVFGISGHGEFGQISNATKVSNAIAYQFSCIMVLVQLPKV